MQKLRSFVLSRRVAPSRRTDGDRSKNIRPPLGNRNTFCLLKGRRFNFEDTHVTDSSRIKKIFVLLVIEFCWAHKIGEWQHAIKLIKIKKHGRPAVSLFRYDLDCIVNAVMKVFYQPYLFDKWVDKIKIPMEKKCFGYIY